MNRDTRRSDPPFDVKSDVKSDAKSDAVSDAASDAGSDGPLPEGADSRGQPATIDRGVGEAIHRAADRREAEASPPTPVGGPLDAPKDEPPDASRANRRNAGAGSLRKPDSHGNAGAGEPGQDDSVAESIGKAVSEPFKSEGS